MISITGLGCFIFSCLCRKVACRFSVTVLVSGCWKILWDCRLRDGICMCPLFCLDFLLVLVVPCDRAVLVVLSYCWSVLDFVYHLC